MHETETLFNMFMELPPDFDQIEQLLKCNKFSRESINESICKFVRECFCEYSDFIDQNNRQPLDEEIHSTYIFPLCKMLLKYGLDPNYVFGDKYYESNIMYEIYWIDKPYISADTLRLLLEHGGDPLLEVDDESIWHLSDFDIIFDVLEGYAQQENYKHTFESRFHFWLVLRGFLSHDESEFKNHELYTYNLVQTDKSNWQIQVILK